MGVLTALITFIQGDKGWLALHKFMRGSFGIAAFLIPVILIYTAVKLGSEQTKKDLSNRVIWCIAMIFLISAAFQIFAVGRIPGSGIGGHVKCLYNNGAELKSGGVASMVIAGPLLKFFGKLGAKLIALVLFFVFGMLLSGRGLIEFLKLLAAPFVFIGRCFNGLQNMLVGGEFVDAFDDDLDDDKEKKDFDADLEAINIANTRKSRQKPSERAAQNKKDVEALPDGFFLDIPLPTDHLIVHDGYGDEEIGPDIDINIEPVPTEEPAAEQQAPKAAAPAARKKTPRNRKPTSSAAESKPEDAIETAGEPEENGQGG